MHPHMRRYLDDPPTTTLNDYHYAVWVGVVGGRRDDDERTLMLFDD